MLSRLVVIGLLAASCRPPAPYQPNGHETVDAARKAEHQLSSAVSPSAPVNAPVEPEIIAHGPRNARRIALTFDACTTRDVSQYDARITKELVAANAPATIFVGGGWGKEEAAHVKELASNALFELGNHSYTHPHMAAIADQKRLHDELAKTQDELFALTGKLPQLFRPPYGEYNERLINAAAEVGLTTVEYDLPSGDPDQHATKERLVEWVLKKAQPGSVIVMHVNHVRFHTAEALPDIIGGLRDGGYELVTVGELLKETHRSGVASGP